MKRIALFASILLAFAFLGTAMPGCTAEQLGQLEQERQSLTELRTATTQAVADLTIEVQALSPDDPVRKATEKNIAKANQVLAKIDQYLPKVDAAIAAVAGGGTLSDPAFRDLADTIPYGRLGLVLAGFGVIVVQQFQKNQAKKALAKKEEELAAENKALVQTVKGVDAAMPVKSPEVKAALDSAQDSDTKVKVAAIRAG